MEYNFSDKISSLKPSAIREILKATSLPGMIPFAAGNPAPDAFPVDDIKEIVFPHPTVGEAIREGIFQL